MFELEDIDINKSIIEIIIEKYEEFNEINLNSFLLDITNYTKIIKRDLSEVSINKIKEQIDFLLKSQNLDFSEIKYLGTGQSYLVLEIGNYVIKFGPTRKIKKNPYQLLPIDQKELENGISIYTSLKALMSKATDQDVQEMYDRIRDDNGIWLDPRKDNLGLIDEIFYIVDYEDVCIFSKEEIEFLRKNGYIRESNISVIDLALLKDDNLDEVYFKEFIRSSLVLLDLEYNYQIKKGKGDKM